MLEIVDIQKNNVTMRFMLNKQRPTTQLNQGAGLHLYFACQNGLVSFSNDPARKSFIL